MFNSYGVEYEGFSKDVSIGKYADRESRLQMPFLEAVHTKSILVKPHVWLPDGLEYINMWSVIKLFNNAFVINVGKILDQNLDKYKALSEVINIVPNYKVDDVAKSLVIQYMNYLMEDGHEIDFVDFRGFINRWIHVFWVVPRRMDNSREKFKNIAGFDPAERYSTCIITDKNQNIYDDFCRIKWSYKVERIKLILESKQETTHSTYGKVILYKFCIDTISFFAAII